jgi:hypothetical protein
LPSQSTPVVLVAVVEAAKCEGIAYSIPVLLKAVHNDLSLWWRLCVARSSPEQEDDGNAVAFHALILNMHLEAVQ